MAKSCFDNPAWHNAVAGMLASDSAEHIADHLIAAIGQAVDHNGTCLLAFHADAPPEVLHHTLEPEGERHYVERYLAGPYLLDPLYELALDDEMPAMCRFRDATPDRFHSSEYYRQYCERTHLKDEMALFSAFRDVISSIKIRKEPNNISLFICFMRYRVHNI